MQQPSPSKDAPSGQSSGLENQTETQQNGPPMSGGSGAAGDSPLMPQMPTTAAGMPLRPGGAQGQGGPMMGPPPYGMPPGYRGMMPPYVSCQPVHFCPNVMVVGETLYTFLHTV